ncbi:2Fe-2S iron-sulfur cluster binding domain-containing protein [Pseudothauera nasutitermitis]|uniref:2Fe-2S iron-sulfur cluster binding domain-containing protein n=1 Tax=Pseudothauera nasutitermitis TaxID=2565930 RepID=A0A4S4AQB1_9RHOO|nr:2Fe-2S iron-sulfur cluster-binding protein [Pseudothauera nasutitermitis]THF61863.1 2Fe-2S iron-sulfur cluster binding domain-containing protein [Pseudothauera nasutitermitis]
MGGRFWVCIDGCEQRVVCADDQNVLRAMELLGRRGIPVGCRGGGCGVCKVQVLRGRYRTSRMSRSCVSAEEEAAGVVLACKLFPASDLALRVVGKMGRALERGCG